MTNGARRGRSRVRPGLACLLLALMLPGLAGAEDLLSTIRKNSVVTVGARESSGALSYFVGGTGHYVGYQVDICNRVLEDIRQQLGLARLEIRYQGVNAQNRMPLLLNGLIDIECGSTAHTAARERDVAFSYTTFVEEVRIAVKVGSGIESIAGLDGKRVVTTTGTTSVQLLRNHAQASGAHYEETFGKDHSDSFLLLESGRADAFVMDSQILAALIATSKSPADYRIIGQPLAVEPIAIMFRKDDPAFRKAVDDSLARMFSSGEIQRLYDKWFMSPIPPAGVSLNLLASPATRAVWAAPTDQTEEDYLKK